MLTCLKEWDTPKTLWKMLNCSKEWYINFIFDIFESISDNLPDPVIESESYRELLYEKESKKEEVYESKSEKPKVGEGESNLLKISEQIAEKFHC